MKLRNVSAYQKYSRYWDEGNINLIPWHRKKFFKRCFRKKAIRDALGQHVRDEVAHIEAINDDFSSDGFSFHAYPERL